MINSNFGLQAAELLRHPILQPYVLKVNLKLNSVRRSSLSTHWPETEYIKKTRFVNPEDVPVSTYIEKRHSVSNDRTLNPSISGTEDYTAELSVGSTHEDLTFGRKVMSKASNVAKTVRLTPSKASITAKKQAELPKNCESVSCRNLNQHYMFLHAHALLCTCPNISLFPFLFPMKIQTDTSINTLPSLLLFPLC